MSTRPRYARRDLAWDLATRFWARVDVRGPEECWPWKLSRQSRGYGQLRFRGKHLLAHRVAWILTRGPIPEGLEPDHSCRMRHCCNPAHMTLRTKAEHGRLSARLRGRGITCGS